VTLKPRLDHTPSKYKKIEIGKTPEKKLWRFSFRFWKQIRYFGLNKSKPTWFVSLLDRLVDYSKEERDAPFKDFRKKEVYRLHEINWQQTGIPISRNDLNWVEKAYLENDADYPFYQLQITQTLGRIIGFFDESDIFNIVLLDPLHNAQPTKSTNYKVDDCSPLPNDFAILLSNTQKIADVHWCKDDECRMRPSVKEIYHSAVEPGVIVMNLLEDFFRYGILLFEDQKPSSAAITPNNKQ